MNGTSPVLHEKLAELYDGNVNDLVNSSRRGPIRRSAGVTPAERYLRSLADRTFLTLWSYAGLFRSPGKELCDLLVVFEHDCLIFSDKHCSFPESGDVAKDWKQWFRRAVAASLKQVRGAERWIRSYPDRIYLDPRCQEPFPLEVPSSSVAHYHLIIVAHGVARRCAKELGGSGSLMVVSDLKGVEAHSPPFTVGDLNPGGSFVHVLDDTSLDILLNTLDTIADLTAYLRKKEALMRSPQKIAAAGEEELLAMYLKRMNKDGEHDFDLPTDYDFIALDEGAWEEFQQNPQRLAQLEANRISYAWDALVETFNKHALEGTQFACWPPGIRSTERIVRIMAREPRLRRRMLAKAIANMLETTAPNLRRLRVIKPTKPGDPYYVLVLFPYRKDRPYDENRQVRQVFLEACCRVVKHEFPDALDIVGIATESGRTGEGSEDAVYLDARGWTKEMEERAIIDQRELAILTKSTILKGTEKEYPEVQS